MVNPFILYRLKGDEKKIKPEPNKLDDQNVREMKTDRHGRKTQTRMHRLHGNIFTQYETCPHS